MDLRGQTDCNLKKHQQKEKKSNTKQGMYCLGGSIPECSSLYDKISMGKILTNLKFLSNASIGV